MEVAFAHDDQRFVLGNALDHVAPATGQFQRGLDGFGARVHRKEFVVAKEFRGEFLIRAETVVVEGT